MLNLLSYLHWKYLRFNPTFIYHRLNNLKWLLRGKLFLMIISITKTKRSINILNIFLKCPKQIKIHCILNLLSYLIWTYLEFNPSFIYHRLNKLKWPLWGVLFSLAISATWNKRSIFVLNMVDRLRKHSHMLSHFQPQAVQ